MLQIMRRILFPLVCLIALASTACSIKKQSKKEATFKAIVPIHEMNTVLKLEPKVLPEEMRAGYDFDLVIVNNSKDTIWFPDDFNVRLLQYDEMEEKWSDVINNNVVPHPGNGIIVEQKGKFPYFVSTIITPDLSREDHPLIRVVVLGKLGRDGQKTDEDVGAWLDVTLPVSK